VWFIGKRGEGKEAKVFDPKIRGMSVKESDCEEERGVHGDGGNWRLTLALPDCDTSEGERNPGSQREGEGTHFASSSATVGEGRAS